MPPRLRGVSLTGHHGHARFVAPWRRGTLNSAIGKSYRLHNTSRRIGRRAAVAGRVIVLLLALTVCCAAAQNRGKGGKRGKGQKNHQTPTASVSAGDNVQNLTNIPTPIGHEARGLPVPAIDT